MSADEDTELRDLVAQTLETNGVLGKIKAQLRASVFVALDEQDAVLDKTPLLNQPLKKFMGTKEGQLVTGLVREFLEFFHLEYSLAVFEPETGCTEQCGERKQLARELNVIESDSSHTLPLLVELVKRGGGDRLSRSHAPGSEDLTHAHISEARAKFHHYDMDNNGIIDKEELRALFMDMFPNFHRNMLDRYVNDEFRAVDKDFSNTIDFDEFLAMYKRLFVLCKSVVSHDIAEVMASPRRSPLEQPSKIPAPLRKSSAKKMKSRQSPTGIASNNNSNSVESKNRRNAATDKSATDKSATSPRTSPLNSRSQDVSSDPEDDSFFDDPVSSHIKSNASDKHSHASDRSRNERGSGGTKVDVNGKASQMSSLAGLPSLRGSQSAADQELKDIDKKMSDLGFDMPEDEDDYEENFESSSVSTKLPTPRSARSDMLVKSIDEDIAEEIDEDIDLSVADDLLKSDHSGPADLTTDRTISPNEQSSAFDYIEDVLLP